MNDQFTRQAQEMFNAAKDARIPDNVQAFAEDSVAKSRDAYSRMNAVSKDSAKVVENVMLAAHAGAKSLGEKVMSNAEANTAAAFDAAQAISRARSLPEAARLQADYFQQQMTVASAQTKELFELSAKVARQTFETINSATAQGIEKLKKTN